MTNKHWIKANILIALSICCGYCQCIAQSKLNKFGHSKSETDNASSRSEFQEPVSYMYERKLLLKRLAVRLPTGTVWQALKPTMLLSRSWLSGKVQVLLRQGRASQKITKPEHKDMPLKASACRCIWTWYADKQMRSLLQNP